MATLRDLEPPRHIATAERDDPSVLRPPVPHAAKLLFQHFVTWARNGRADLHASSSFLIVTISLD
jgi:hypothetical protein